MTATLLETPSTNRSRPVPPDATDWLSLRILGPERHGEIVRINGTKCTIGSSSSCDVRLSSKGVRAVHCTIVCGPRGIVVRRWSEPTLLNGRDFNDAPLRSGDRLTCGPVEVEVVLQGRVTTPRLPNDELLPMSLTVAMSAVGSLTQAESAVAASCVATDEVIAAANAAAAHKLSETRRLLRSRTRRVLAQLRAARAEQQRLEADHRLHDDTQRTLLDRVHALENLLADYRDRAENAERQHETLQQERQAFLSQLALGQTKEDELRRLLEQEEQAHQALERKAESLTSQLGDQERKLAEAEKYCQELQEQIRQFESNVAVLEEYLAAQAASAAETNSESATNASETTDVGSDAAAQLAAAKDAELAALVRELQNLQAEVLALRANQEAAKPVVQELEPAVAATDSDAVTDGDTVAETSAGLENACDIDATTAIHMVNQSATPPSEFALTAVDFVGEVPNSLPPSVLDQAFPDAQAEWTEVEESEATANTNREIEDTTNSTNGENEDEIFARLKLAGILKQAEQSVAESAENEVLAAIRREFAELESLKASSLVTEAESLAAEDFVEDQTQAGDDEFPTAELAVDPATSTEDLVATVGETSDLSDADVVDDESATNSETETLNSTDVDETNVTDNAAVAEATETVETEAESEADAETETEVAESTSDAETTVEAEAASEAPATSQEAARDPLAAWKEKLFAEEEDENRNGGSLSGQHASFGHHAKQSQPAPTPPPVPQKKTAKNGDEEDSIEDYMARLLQRVRGPEAPKPVEPPKPAAIAPAASRVMVAEASAAQEITETVEPEQKPAKPYTPRPVPKDFLNKLATMREIANSTTRVAIESHQIRSQKESARTKLIMAGAVVMISLGLLFYTREDPQIWQYAGALIGFGLGGYWTMQSFGLHVRAMVKSRKMKS